MCIIFNIYKYLQLLITKKIKKNFNKKVYIKNKLFDKKKNIVKRVNKKNIYQHVF